MRRQGPPAATLGGPNSGPVARVRQISRWPADGTRFQPTAGRLPYVVVRLSADRRQRCAIRKAGTVLDAVNIYSFLTDLFLGQRKANPGNLEAGLNLSSLSPWNSWLGSQMCKGLDGGNAVLPM